MGLNGGRSLNSLDIDAVRLDKRRIFIADATLILVAFLWGTGTPLTADLVRTLTPIWGSAIRMTVAGTALLLMYPRKIRNASLTDLKNGFILAAIVSTIYILVGFALVYSTASKQSFIIGGSVLMVPFFVWLVNHKKPPLCVFLGAVLATSGLLVMAFAPGMRFNFGDMLNLIVCFLSAWHVIFIERMVRQTDPTTLVALQLPLMGIIMTATALIFEPLPDFAAMSAVTWGEIFFTGLVATVAAFILQARAQKNTTASHAAIILSMESVFGYMLSVLSGQDPFIPQGAVGGMLILAGVLVSEAKTILTKPETG